MTWRGLSETYLLVMTIWLFALIVALRLLLKIRRRGKEKPKLKTLANAGLSLWLLLFPLTLLEFGFALFYDRTDSFNLSNVSRKWFVKYAQPFEKPLVFSNGEGIVYRDDEPFPESLGDEQRHVCFLGDSFAYGHGINRVEDRFSNRIRARLETASPGRIAVSNLAKPGTDLHWAEAILTRLFEDGRRVDAAVYTLCLNDIESFHPDFRTYYSGDWVRGSDFFLFRDTYFFNLLYFRWQQFRRPQVKNYYDFVADYYAGEPWEKMSEQLLRVRDLCEEHGCEFRLVIFPFLHALDGETRFDVVHVQIEEFCREHGIPVVDLLPVLKPHADEGLVVGAFDAHPNVRANELAAEAIERQLLSDWFEAAK